MNRHPIRRSFAALATVLSFLLLLSSPASADPVIVGGTIEIGNPPFLVVPLGEEAEDPPCDAQLNDIDPFEIDFTGDDESGDWETSGGFAGVQLIGTTWFKFQFDFSNLSGTYQLQLPAPPHVYDLAGGGQLNIDVWEINIPDPPDPDEPCVKKDFQCTITVPVVLVAPSTYEPPAGGPPPPPGNGAGGRLLVNADSVAPHIQTFPQCPPALWIFHGQPASIVNLEIDPL